MEVYSLLPMAPTTELAKLIMHEISGVDDPANETPGWAVLKAAAGDGDIDGLLIEIALGMEGLTKASDSKAPYGDVTYADPGKQEDGKKRYPLDTETHIRAAWSYISQADNASKYSAADLKTIKGKIAAAMKRIGADVASDTTKASTPDATTILQRVRKLVSGEKDEDLNMDKSELTSILDERDAALVEKVSAVVKAAIETPEVPAVEGTEDGTVAKGTEGEPAPAVEAPVVPEATAPEAITAEDVTKAVTDALAVALAPYNEIIEKALDRIERVEDRFAGAARKSVAGQESQGSDEADATPTLKSAFDRALAGEKVTLT